MKKYDCYKDSGIEWIGEIPSHWKNTRIKFTVNEKNSLFIDGDWIESKFITEEGIRYITTGNVKVGYYSEQGNGYISNQTFTDLNCTEVFEGDLILSRLNNPIGRACIVPNLNSRIVTSVDNVIYRPDSNLNKRYLLYLFSSREYFEHTELISRGATMQRISRGMLGNLKIPLPDIEEQTTIANYLDQKTTQIDDLIAKKERLIQLLEEERTAIINQAVTKGLDPTVPMKDSGIDWLGEIPAHWGRARIKTLVKIKVCDGPHETPEWKEDGVPFISAEAIKGNQIDLSFKRGYISEEQHQEYCKKSKVQKGDILFCKSGSTTGKSALVEIDDEFGIWSPLAIIRVDERKISNRYMFQSIQSSLFRNQVETSWTFGTQPNIGMGALENLWIAIPPLNEQESIDEYLISELKNFDIIIAKSQQEIELLKEYKIALISEVVTGKVDVSTALNASVRDEKLN